MTATAEKTLKPIFFDPKSQEYKLAVMRYYGFLAGKLAGSSVVKCESFSKGLYTVASATDVWTDYKVVHMHRLGDAWACEYKASKLCWHIAGVCATHYYTNEIYNPFHLLHGLLADKNDKKHLDWPVCFLGGCQHKVMFEDARYCQVHYDAAEMLQAVDDLKAQHDPFTDHSPDCAGCKKAAGNPDTTHWPMVSSEYWKCRKMWGLGRCGGRAVSIGGYCSTCAANGWDDLLSGR